MQRNGKRNIRLDQQIIDEGLEINKVSYRIFQLRNFHVNYLN
jgi:hypothetical protein